MLLSSNVQPGQDTHTHTTSRRSLCQTGSRRAFTIVQEITLQALRTSIFGKNACEASGQLQYTPRTGSLARCIPQGDEVSVRFAQILPWSSSWTLNLGYWGLNTWPTANPLCSCHWASHVKPRAACHVCHKMRPLRTDALHLRNVRRARELCTWPDLAKKAAPPRKTNVSP